MQSLYPEAPELLGVGRLPDGSPFGRVAIVRDGERRTFRFAVSEAGYGALSRAVALRPFSTMPGTPYRRFFNGFAMQLGPVEKYLLDIWVESGKARKTISLEAPRDLTGTLDWFLKVKSFEETAHLTADA